MKHVIVDALGAPIAIDISGLLPVDRAMIKGLWGDAAGERKEPVAHVELRTAFEFASVIADLSSQVTGAALSARRKDLWLLHACGLADDLGRVVAFVGPSGAGKTTIAMNLGRTLRYVSDESVGVDASGRVFPYRKPLSLVMDTDSPKEQVAPSSVGLGNLPSADLTLSAIVILDRRLTPTEPVMTRIPDSRAITALAGQTSYLAERGRPLQTMVSHLGAIGGAYELTYSDVHDLPHVVETVFRDRTVRHTSTVWHDDGGAPSANRIARGGDSGDGAIFIRTAYIDAVAIEAGQLAILQGRRGPTAHLRVLAPQAARVWRTLAHPAPIANGADRRIAEQLVERGVLAVAAP